MSTATVDTPAAPQPRSARNAIQGGLLDPKMLWKSLPDALR